MQLHGGACTSFLPACNTCAALLACMEQIQSNALAALEAVDPDMAEDVLNAGCITGDRVNGLCDGVTGDWYVKVSGCAVGGDQCAGGEVKALPPLFKAVAGHHSMDEHVCLHAQHAAACAACRTCAAACAACRTCAACGACNCMLEHARACVHHVFCLILAHIYPPYSCSSIPSMLLSTVACQ